MSERRPVVLLAGLMLAGLLTFDLSTSAAPNPYQAPPAIALGSGLASGGAHCASLPSGASR